MKRKSILVLIAILSIALIGGATAAFAYWISGSRSDTQTLNIGTKEITIDLGSATVGGVNEFYPDSYMTFTYTIEITDTSGETPITEANITATVTATDGTDIAADFFDITITGNATQGKVQDGETITITVTMKSDAQKPDFTSVTLSVTLS